MPAADIYLVEIRYVKLYMVYTKMGLDIYWHISHIRRKSAIPASQKKF